MADAEREQEVAEKHPEKTPPAGPHAQDRLTDHDKTPGTGALPDSGEPEVDVGPD